MSRPCCAAPVLSSDGEVLGHRYLWTDAGIGTSGWLIREATIRAATVTALRFMLDNGVSCPAAVRTASIMGQVSEDRVWSTHLLTRGLAGDDLIWALIAVEGETLRCERPEPVNG